MTAAAAQAPPSITSNRSRADGTRGLDCAVSPDCSDAIVQPLYLNPADDNPMSSDSCRNTALSDVRASRASHNAAVRAHIATVCHRHDSRAHAAACGVRHAHTHKARSRAVPLGSGNAGASPS